MVRAAHRDCIARLSRLDRLQCLLGSPDMSTWMACTVVSHGLHGQLGRPAWSAWMACLVVLEGLRGQLGRPAWSPWKAGRVSLEGLTIQVGPPAHLSSHAWWCDT